MTVAERLTARIKRHTDSSQPAVSAGDIRELLREHAELVEAGNRMMNDHQTSDRHHPDHILVPRSAFEAMRSVLTKIGGDA